MQEVFWEMRKPLVGVAAALMLTTLVIVIVPAFAQGELWFADETRTYFLEVNPTTHWFWLWHLFDGGDDHAVGLLCYGVGARVVKGVLAIMGKCQYDELVPLAGGATDGGSRLPVSFLFGGGKVQTGPIKLVLVTVSKPPTKPMTFTMWPTSVIPTPIDGD